MRYLNLISVCAMQLVVAASAFSQGVNESFELRLRSGQQTELDIGAFGFAPWVVALICLVLFGIMVATLWPNDSSSSPYQRQRKFSRIDQLFFKVTGYILDEDESKTFLKDVRESPVALEKRRTPPEQLTLLGLSHGGCSFLGDERLHKGMVVLLNLDTLPDFPSKHLVAAVKIVWVREEKTHGKKYCVAGGKFVYTSSQETSENLRQYLNYLMNEPAI